MNQKKQWCAFIDKYIEHKSKGDEYMSIKQSLEKTLVNMVI